jgi:RNA polymerase sigma-70 factor, ECF subfamily
MELEELVKSVQRGNLESFALLVRRFERVSVYRAWNIIGDFHEAQDIAQEAMVVAFEKIDSLKSPASFGPWLLEIVRRLASKYLHAGKKVGRNTVSFNDVIIESKLSNSQMKAPNWQEKNATILQAIAKLPGQLQDVIILRYFDEQTTPQIAQSIGRPIGTVTKQLSRAIQALRSLLSEIHHDAR